MKSLALRKLKSGATTLLVSFFTLLVLIPLVLVLFHIVKMGFGSLTLEFFRQIPAPPGEAGGGMANGLAGSVIMILLASIIGLPTAVFGALYLSEFGNNKFAGVIRFSADVLSGVPSIITGMVAYTLIVLPLKGFSAIAGAFALALIMIPIILRTTEEQLKMVPTALREAALALGVPFWRVSLKVVLPSALSGVITGVLLAVARVSGETAPLLFTALGNQFWSKKLTEPMAALPLQIFSFAISPYQQWHNLAYAGAVVLIFIMFSISLSARFLGSKK